MAKHKEEKHTSAPKHTSAKHTTHATAKHVAHKTSSKAKTSHKSNGNRLHSARSMRVMKTIDKTNRIERAVIGAGTNVARALGFSVIGGAALSAGANLANKGTKTVYGAVSRKPHHQTDKQAVNEFKSAAIKDRKKHLAYDKSVYKERTKQLKQMNEEGVLKTSPVIHQFKYDAKTAKADEKKTKRDIKSMEPKQSKKHTKHDSNAAKSKNPSNTNFKHPNTAKGRQETMQDYIKASEKASKNKNLSESQRKHWAKQASETKQQYAKMYPTKPSNEKFKHPNTAKGRQETMQDYIKASEKASKNKNLSESQRKHWATQASETKQQYAKMYGKQSTKAHSTMDTKKPTGAHKSTKTPNHKGTGAKVATAAAVGTAAGVVAGTHTTAHAANTTTESNTHTAKSTGHKVTGSHKKTSETKTTAAHKTKQASKRESAATDNTTSDSMDSALDAYNSSVADSAASAAENSTDTQNNEVDSGSGTSATSSTPLYVNSILSSLDQNGNNRFVLNASKDVSSVQNQSNANTSVQPENYPAQTIDPRIINELLTLNHLPNLSSQVMNSAAQSGQKLVSGPDNVTFNANVNQSNGQINTQNLQSGNASFNHSAEQSLEHWLNSSSMPLGGYATPDATNTPIDTSATSSNTNNNSTNSVSSSTSAQSPQSKAAQTQSGPTL